MTDPGELLLFQTEHGRLRIDAPLVNETVRLSAGRIADLFQRDAEPSPVEQHFDDAVKKAKQLAQPKKKTGEGK